MLRYFKVGKDHRGARIPCRLKDCSTSMELMVFWSSQNDWKYYNVMAMVEAVHGGLEMLHQQYNGPVEETTVKELHLPLWEHSYEAQNIAHPVSKASFKETKILN